MSPRTLPILVACFVLSSLSPSRADAAPPTPAPAPSPSPGAAKDRPMVPMPKLAGRLLLSVREEERGVRRLYQGKVARIEQVAGEARRWAVILDGKQPLRRLAANPRSSAGAEVERPVTRATPDRDRFIIDLPKYAAVPLTEGDVVRAEFRLVEVGAFARDTHARLWRNGKPLLFINELPDGWSAEAGAIVDASRAPIVVRSITFKPPSGAPFEAAGFVSGTVAGVLTLAYGAATRWEGKPSAGPGSPMVPPPNDFAATFATALLWAQPD